LGEIGLEFPGSVNKNIEPGEQVVEIVEKTGPFDERQSRVGHKE